MTEEEIEDIFWGDEYEEVTKPDITGTSRWSTFYEQVFKKKSDGTFWEASWSRGSTEMQDEGIEGFEFHEVVPVEKTFTVYERKS